MFGISFFVCKVNGIPLYNLSCDTSCRTLNELTLQSLDQDSQLFVCGVTASMFSKTHGIIILDLSGSHDMSIVPTGSVHLDSTFAESLA